MMSPFPWILDENDPSIIYDADGDVVAANYRFINVDDFEGIVRITLEIESYKNTYDR